MNNHEQTVLDKIAALEADSEFCELCGGSWHGLPATSASHNRQSGCPGELATEEERAIFVRSLDRYQQASEGGTMTARTPAPWALHGSVKRDYWTHSPRSKG